MEVKNTKFTSERNTICSFSYGLRKIMKPTFTSNYLSISVLSLEIQSSDGGVPKSFRTG